MWRIVVYQFNYGSLDRRMCLPIWMNFDRRLLELWWKIFWLAFLRHGVYARYSGNTKKPHDKSNPFEQNSRSWIHCTENTSDKQRNSITNIKWSVAPRLMIILDQLAWKEWLSASAEVVYWAAWSLARVPVKLKYGQKPARCQGPVTDLAYISDLFHPAQKYVPKIV